MGDIHQIHSMITVHFSKLFIKGSLKGIQTDESLKFPDFQSAAGWISRMETKKHSNFHFKFQSIS